MSWLRQRRRWVRVVLAVVLPLSLYRLLTERASWRPQRLSLSGRPGEPVAFSPDGTLLACGSGQANVALWDTKTWRLLHVLRPSSIILYSLAFSPDSRLIATGSHDDDVRLWDTHTGKLVRTLRGMLGGSRVLSLAFSPDGRRVAGACYHGRLEWWLVRSGQRERFVGRYWRAGALAFAPSGATIAASVSWSGVDPDAPPRNDDQYHGPFDAVKIIDARTGRLNKTLAVMQPIRDQGDDIAALAYSPDGKLLASGSQQALRLWNIQSGRLIRTLAIDVTGAHEVRRVLFAPDGQTLFSANADGVVTLWDVRTARVLRRLKHAGAVWDMALSPAGDTLVTVSEVPIDSGRGTLTLWRIR